MVMRAQRDLSFRDIVNGAALNLCDTVGLLLASRVRNGPVRARVTGVELVGNLAARSAEHSDVRLYFLGSSGDTAALAACAVKRRYPRAVIAARGTATSRPTRAALSRPRSPPRARTSLCVGLGSPKQEWWLSQYGVATGCGVGIGVGGTLDVLAGRVQRAPRIVQRTGLEWAYRLVREPYRWRRQLALPALRPRGRQEAGGAAETGKIDGVLDT